VGAGSRQTILDCLVPGSRLPSPKGPVGLVGSLPHHSDSGSPGSADAAQFDGGSGLDFACHAGGAGCEGSGNSGGIDLLAPVP
jgi:hypothetical protein